MREHQSPSNRSQEAGAPEACARDALGPGAPSVPAYQDLFAVRVKADVAARIRRAADAEGNTTAAILRRALTIGLASIDGERTP
jgi:hypothetical protein